MVNLSLLAKWRWWFLHDGNAFWKEVLLDKYGRSIDGLVVLEDYAWQTHASRWWRDIIKLCWKMTQK